MSRSTRRRQETSRSSSAVNGDVEEQHNTMSSGPNAEVPSDLRGDRCNIAILFFLYLLQGIPMGLAAAIPMLMQSHGVSYKQQAEFSLVNWPFSLKLLWAPIVDSIYSNRFGRRKSWLIPAQLLIGFFMIFLGANVDSWLGDGKGEKEAEPCVGFLTLMFFILNFLAATQDIAVDGWALTMLKRRNVAYASTCNSVGQSAGYFFGYVVFMALHSPDITNRYLRSVPQPDGLVTISSFLNMWGWIFLTVTILVAILKREQVVHNPEHEPEPDLGFYRAYGLLWDISKLPSIRVLAFILLTAKIGFSACDAVTGLKLVDAGVPKEHLAFLAVLLVPLQIVLPIAISKYTTGSRPLDVYIAAVPYRLFFNLVAGAIVYFTPSLITKGDVPLYYYIGLLLFYTCHQITLYMMFVAIMSFFVRISDPAVGGTYMTLLNTLANMGTTWPSTLSLYIVDSLTFRGCSSPLLSNNDCSSPLEVQDCEAAGGICTVQLDGYYVEMALCTVLGLLWLWWARPRIQALQIKEVREWKVRRQRIR